MQLNIFYSTLKTFNITMRLRIGGFTLVTEEQSCTNFKELDRIEPLPSSTFR